MSGDRIQIIPSIYIDPLSKENLTNENKSDMVNHPSHYLVVDRSGMTHECLYLIQALGLGFNDGNAFKYLWRSGKKDETKRVEDLKKAVFYLQEEIKILEY